MTMGNFDLNLSTKPFPAYRVANVALVCALIALAVISIWQASGFMQYSEMAGAIRPAERNSRVEADALGKRVAELESRLDRPESASKLNEILFLNHLILRKNLSWTKLFGILEGMVPENVYFTSLVPNIGADGTVTLNLGLRARTMDDLKQFLVKVEQSPLFKKLDVKVEEKKETTARDGVAAAPARTTDIDVTLSAVYYPQGGQ
jgi:Tfp pilus assembly protein PilN